MIQTASFRVDPRLTAILGESYSCSERALRELIDNAWDAEATEVRVTLPAQGTRHQRHPAQPEPEPEPGNSHFGGAPIYNRLNSFGNWTVLAVSPSKAGCKPALRRQNETTPNFLRALRP